MQEYIEFLMKKTKELGAELTDIIAISGSDISASVRNGEKENLSSSESSSLGVRVLIGKKQASVSIDGITLNDLELLAERVVSMAKLVPDDKFAGLAPSDLWSQNILDLDLYDENKPSVTELYKRALDLENIALKYDNKITNSEGADAGYSSNQIWVANSLGFNHSYKSSFSSISVSVIASDNDKMERDYAYSSSRHYSDLKNIKDIGLEAAKRAVERLNPRQPKTGNFPVIFDPRVGKSILGSFASAINGFSISRGTSFLKNSLNENIFKSDISIIDDPFIKRGLSSRPFDVEGLAGRKMKIIDNGVLTSWLLDLRSAQQLGLKPTGHATRSVSSLPHPTVHNMYIENGNISVSDLILDIKEGIYITETFGSGVNLVTGDYSQGASGFWIENGKITYPINEFTIAGKLADMFKSIKVANDLKFEYSLNTPTFKIDNLTVAGQ